MTQTASFSFEPVVKTVSQGDVVAVDVMMYSGDTPVISSDVWISYNPEVLTIQNPQKVDIEKGPLFENVNARTIAPGSLYLYGIQNSKTSTTPANGKIATVYFTAQKSGQALLRFECVPFSKQTSQIIESNSELTNIIHCESTRSHTSTITVTSDSNVLGASTRNAGISTTSILVVGGLLAILIGLFVYRYRKLARELDIKP
ncbi:hypothetical protein KBD81_05350 [Candidatus Woesebacteria bacterium]|nr:hypothetical protein [Candidatus Woesebacteria bacterium]